MAEGNLIPDDLLRQLIGVGQVDVLVGVPTLNHGATIGDVVRAVQASFITHFPRQRTVVLNSDAGSTDGTPEIVRNCRLDESGGVTATHGLRTSHRITTPYHGTSGKGSSLRLIFAAAELLQASVIVVLDPDVTNLTPSWVAELAKPVRDRQGVDFVAPVYQRLPEEGLLVTQLLRPTVRALYGWRLREPLVAEFGCSGRFAAHCVERPVWNTDLVGDGASCWIACEALAGGFGTCQASLGRRELAADRPRPQLSELFRQVVGATFASIEAHSGYWLPRVGSEEVPTLGRAGGIVGPGTGQDSARLLESFGHDVRNLNEILRRILGAETFASVEAASTSHEGPRYPDALWAATLAGFVLAFHHAVMRRDHITQALVPLYLARTGAFLEEHGTDSHEAVEAAIESVSICLEQIKPRIVERWDNQHEVEHG